MGNPTAVRAVGTACATNPLPVVVPCHRVLRSDGGLGGYLGGLEVKTTLLDLDFGPLFDLVEENPELATYASPPLAEVRRIAAGRPGLTVAAPGTVTVRFR